VKSPNIWIAEDPTLPCTAFAVCTADEEFREDIQETLQEWMDRYGVKGRLINREVGLKMLNAWDRSKSKLEGGEA
jgi:hypothetical protein